MGKLWHSLTIKDHTAMKMYKLLLYKITTNKSPKHKMKWKNADTKGYIMYDSIDISTENRQSKPILFRDACSLCNSKEKQRSDCRRKEVVTNLPVGETGESSSW